MRALKILGQRDDAIRERARREVGRSLDEASAANLGAAAIRAHEIMQAEFERALAATTKISENQPACAAGCSYCCHVHAYATAPEIIAVADHLRATLDSEALEALGRRLSEHNRVSKTLDDEARWAARIPCALLDASGRCSIYAVRPLRCRAFHSCDAGACRGAFEGRSEAMPRRAPLLDRAMDAVEAGYDAALASRGVPADEFQLEIGLAIALEDPSAAARFLAGEPIFDAARPPL